MGTSDFAWPVPTPVELSVMASSPLGVTALPSGGGLAYTPAAWSLQLQDPWVPQRLVTRSQGHALGCDDRLCEGGREGRSAVEMGVVWKQRGNLAGP